ncbi:hypothetical protein OAO01_02005 [Oligoflexia bacterium]|nr:hypothetical protein [Oligoflexia bacterium]
MTVLPKYIFQIVVIIFVGSTFFLTQQSFAIDTNGDGYDEILVYRAAQSAVEVYDLKGTLLEEIPIPTNTHNKKYEPLLYPGIVDGKLFLHSLKVKSGEIFFITSAGIVGQVKFSQLKKSTVFFYDINGNGVSDIVKITNKSGATEVQLDPIAAAGTAFSMQVPKGSHYSLAFSNGPHIASISKTKKKKKKKKKKGSSSFLTPIFGGTPLGASFSSKAAPLYPAPQAPATTVAIQKTSVTAFDLFAGTSSTISTGKSDVSVPGIYIEGSQKQVLQVKDSTARVYDIGNQGLLLAEFVIGDGAGGGGGDNGGGSGGSGQDDAYAKTLLTKIKNAYNMGQKTSNPAFYYEMVALYEELKTLDMSSAVEEQIYKELAKIFAGSAATLPATQGVLASVASFFVVGPPVYFSQALGASGGDAFGCDNWKLNALWKPVSDNTGKVVVLPRSYYKKLMAYKANGKSQNAQFSNSGPSNGYVGTWRTPKSCSQFSSPLTLVAIDYAGKRSCKKIVGTCSRHEAN